MAATWRACFDRQTYLERLFESEKEQFSGFTILLKEFTNHGEHLSTQP
jgi:hypothetical protein